MINVPLLKNINNINGINPNKWGPHLWKSIHYISLNYSNNPSQKTKSRYKKFFTSLKDVIPCSECKKHYTETLILIPLDNCYLKNRTNLFNWTVKIHNRVNKLKNKPILSYKNALLLYTNNNQNNIYNILYVLIILIILKILITKLL